MHTDTTEVGYSCLLPNEDVSMHDEFVACSFMRSIFELQRGKEGTIPKDIACCSRCQRFCKHQMQSSGGWKDEGDWRRNDLMLIFSVVSVLTWCPSSVAIGHH